MTYSTDELKKILNKGMEKVIEEQIKPKNIPTSKINIKTKANFVNFMKRTFKDEISLSQKIGDSELMLSIEHDEYQQNMNFYAALYRENDNSIVSYFSISRNVSYSIQAKGKKNNGYQMYIYASKPYIDDNEINSVALDYLITNFYGSVIIGILNNMKDENICIKLTNLNLMQYLKATKLEKIVYEINKSKPNILYTNHFSNEKIKNNYKRLRLFQRKLRANRMFVSSNVEDFNTLIKSQEGQIHGVKFNYLGRSFTASIRMVEEDIRILETSGHYNNPNHGAESLLYTVDDDSDILHSFLDYIHDDLESNALMFLINKPLEQIKLLLIDNIPNSNPDKSVIKNAFYNTKDDYLNSIFHSLYTAFETLDTDTNRILFVLDKLKRGEYTEDQVSVSFTFCNELAADDTLPDDDFSQKHILITFEIFGETKTIKIHQLKNWFNQ